MHVMSSPAQDKITILALGSWLEKQGGTGTLFSPTLLTDTKQSCCQVLWERPQGLGLCCHLVSQYL